MTDARVQNYLHKQQYQNQKTHLFDGPSSRNHFQLSYVVYPRDGPVRIEGSKLSNDCHHGTRQI